MDVKPARIVTRDQDGNKGSTSAFLTMFTNALHQRRQIAFDGQTWWVQAKMDNRTPFTVVGTSEVPEDVKERMAAFLKARWEKSLGAC